MEAVLIFISGVCVTLLSIKMGEYLPLVLPKISPKLERKPFGCTPCATFHLHWIISILIALFFESWGIAVMGIISAFAIFFIVKYQDSKKVTE